MKIQDVVKIVKADLSEYYEEYPDIKEEYEEYFSKMDECTSLDELINNLDAQEIDDNEADICKYILRCIVNEKAG